MMASIFQELSIMEEQKIFILFAHDSNQCKHTCGVETKLINFNSNILACSRTQSLPSPIRSIVGDNTAILT